MGELKEATEEDNKMLASQLREPTGEVGIEVAKVMNATNEFMIQETIDSLDLSMNDEVLEIGHGNGLHIGYLMERAPNLNYCGLDISELMHLEAKEFCENNDYQSQTDFVLYNGLIIPLPGEKFDKIFTVNTLYFWEKPVLFLNEIHRVLKPGGNLCVAFVTKQTMEQLAFTKYGFNKYGQEEFHQIVVDSNFNQYALTAYSEEIEGKLGDGMVDREYLVAKFTK